MGFYAQTLKLAVKRDSACFDCIAYSRPSESCPKNKKNSLMVCRSWLVIYFILEMMMVLRRRRVLPISPSLFGQAPFLCFYFAAVVFLEAQSAR